MVIGYDEMLKENYKVRGCTEVVLPQARLERGLMEMFEPTVFSYFFFFIIFVVSLRC